MAFKRLSPEALFVDRGFGQVEPNHLSAQRTGEIYAQLPVASTINILENGQFVKYNYAQGQVDFAGPGEWMLVFNEVKVYADRETDEDFAMIRRDYVGSVYSPRGVGDQRINGFADSDVAAAGLMKTIGANNEIYGDGHLEGDPTAVGYTGADYGRNHFAIGNKYEIENLNKPQLANYSIPDGANGMMVPRVFKTHEGDIFTTNTIAATKVTLGEFFAPNAHGYLAKIANIDAAPFVWQAVKIYNLGDMQKAVKFMRVK